MSLFATHPLCLVLCMALAIAGFATDRKSGLAPRSSRTEILATEPNLAMLDAPALEPSGPNALPSPKATTATSSKPGNQDNGLEFINTSFENASPLWYSRIVKP